MLVWTIPNPMPVLVAPRVRRTTKQFDTTPYRKNFVNHARWELYTSHTFGEFMYIALWIVTAIFAALFAMAGTMKVIKP